MGCRKWVLQDAPQSWRLIGSDVYAAACKEKAALQEAEGMAGWDARRKRARFRSWHRGTREMDLVLGPFADARLAGLTMPEIEQYERLLDLPDTDLLSWITGAKPVPSDAEPVFFEVLVFATRPNL